LTRVLSAALRERLLTTAWLLPVIVGAVLLLPTPLFALAMAVIVLLAAWEWGPLAGVTDGRVRLAMLITLALTLALLWAFAPASPVPLVAATLWWIGFTLMLPTLRPRVVGRGADALLLPLGLLVLAAPWLALVRLHGEPAYGPFLVLGLMIMIWAGDSAAYFIGGRFGRRKLAPRLSPGKTWAGLYAALVAASAVALVTGLLLGLDGAALGQLTLLGALTLALSVVGDLFESWLKRRRGLKDSGALLPGHGGMLDRIDSMTAAAPLFALGLIWLGVAT
jgi:phosphatidate cytidylyltransferase